MARIRIAFDLDGVIIDKPPLVPKRLLEWLFRGWKENGLHYRFPHSKIEQKIRKISHFYLFRPPIKKNIEFVKKLSKNPKYELYAVSGRYSFLREETEKWLEKRKIKGIFKEVFINMPDEQPHLYKEKKLREMKAEIFVDDDGLLADYLAEKSKAKIYCFSKGASCTKAIKVVELREVAKDC